MELAEEGRMKDALQQYLQQGMSRRQFAQTLASLGYSAAAVTSVIRTADAANPPANTRGVEVTGTGGEILLECIRAAGITDVFDCNSTGQNPFYDAMLMNPDMSMIIALHEGHATAMAQGYEMASGRTAALMLPSIGTPNSSSNMYNAWKDRSSIAVFSDGDNTDLAGRDGFQQIDDWLAPISPFTKWRWQVDHPERINEVARRAIKMAGTQPGGPVYVRIPGNILGAQDVTTTIFPGETFQVTMNMEPKAELIEAAADALVAAESPVMNTGPEVTRGGANQDVIELAELLGMRVSQSMSVYSDFPMKHPLFAGYNAMGFPRTGRPDVFLNLGGHVPDRTIISGNVPKKARLINARVEAERIANFNPTDVAIVAGSKETTRALIDAVNDRMPARQRKKVVAPRMEKANSDYTRWQNRLRSRAEKTWNSNGPISGDRLCYEMEQVLEKDAIVVVETGARTPQSWFDFGPGKKTLLGQTTGFALGWGVSAGIGAKVAQPNRQVVAMMGDGAFLFGQTESLWTAARYNIPVIIVVFNNRSYDGERGRLASFSTLRRSDPDNWKDISCYLGNPDVDYVTLAKGFGVDGGHIRTLDDIQPVLQRAMAVTREGGPFMIDASILRKGLAKESTWHADISIAARRDRMV
jgi:benzoylformate decarboxylase